MRRAAAALVCLAAWGCDRRSGGAAPAPAPAVSQETPEQAWRGFREARLRADGAALWSFRSEAFRARVAAEWEPRVAAARVAGGPELDALADEAGVTLSDIAKQSAREVADRALARELAAQAREPGRRAEAESEEWLGADVQGDRATCRIRRGPRELSLVLVREPAGWRLSPP